MDGNNIVWRGVISSDSGSMLVARYSCREANVEGGYMSGT